MSKLYKQSETTTINRSEINFAPYNPKNHSQKDIDLLKRNIKNVAFLGGIVFNKTTSNLIDGHKRIMTLDLIHKYDGTPETDYQVKVELIELDEKTEKEQNIFQTTSRTELDAYKLADLIADIDYEAAGLTDEDLLQLEVEVPNFEFAAPQVQSDILPTSKKQIQEQSAEQRKEAIKAAKQKTTTDNESAPYVTITFDSFENKAYFMERFGFNHYDLYIKGERFEQMIERIE